MAAKRILVVDDDGGVRFGVRDYLSTRGFDVDEASSCTSAEETIQAHLPDVVVLDYRLPDGDALELLPRLKAADADMPVVLLTGHGTIELAVRAIQAGADQFLTKPVELSALHLLVQRLLENRRLRQKQAAGLSRPGQAAVDPFIGTSAVIRRLAEEARQALQTDSPVLILGETGAGKGVLAGWLHRNGSRADEAFVDVSCAGLSRELLDSELFGHEKGAFTGAVSTKQGLLEVAHHGTVFLDEIGDTDPAVQAKLLKVIEEKRFRRLGDTRDRHADVHLIAATHSDLVALAREKRFREDLYYRISVIPLHVPALRERREDIPPLARTLLCRIASELGRPVPSLTDETIEALADFSWPGNVRELRNVLERALLRSRGGTVTRRHLALEGPTPTAPAGGDENLTLQEIERRHIARVLEAEGGHVERAAGRLGIPRSSLYQKIKEFGLSRR